MRQFASATVAPHPVAADLGLDVDVFLDLAIPVAAAAGEVEVGNRADLPFGCPVTQLFSGVDDLAQTALERDLVAVEKLADFVDLGLVGIGQHRVGTQRNQITAQKDLAAGHVLAEALARLAEDDHAPAVHHVAGHEVGISATQQRPLLHDLAGPAIPCCP